MASAQFFLQYNARLVVLGRCLLKINLDVRGEY